LFLEKNKEIINSFSNKSQTKKQIGKLYKKKYTLAGQINMKSLKFVQSKRKKNSNKLQQKQVKTLQRKTAS
jgi:hypothetical protein